MRTGEKLALLISFALKGECGPFGGEDPIVQGNKVTFCSQTGKSVYTFHDDGTIYVKAHYTVGIEDKPIDEDFEYDNLEDLLKHDDSWLCNFDLDMRVGTLYNKLLNDN